MRIDVQIPESALREVEITVNEKLHALCDKECQYLAGDWQTKFFCELQKWFLVTGRVYFQDNYDEYWDNPLMMDYELNAIGAAARCKPCLEIGDPEEGNVIRVRLLKVSSDI